MSKITVAYWSGTGNTEAMANEVAEGAKAAGAEVVGDIVKYDTTDVDKNQRVDYRVAKQEESKIKNQILCNK